MTMRQTFGVSRDFPRYGGVGGTPACLLLAQMDKVDGLTYDDIVEAEKKCHRPSVIPIVIKPVVPSRAEIRPDIHDIPLTDKTSSARERRVIQEMCAS